MTEGQKFARVPATVDLAGWQRHAGYKATAGELTGRGTSQAAALADLGSLITAACQRSTCDVVSFAWDADNSGLWIAVPDVMHGGHTEHMLTFRADGSPVRARTMGGGKADAREAFASCQGFTAVTDQPGQQHAGRKLPAMPDEVREMLSTAADALTGLGRFGDNLTEAEAGAQSALADLADYVSAQFAPSELDR